MDASYPADSNIDPVTNHIDIPSNKDSNTVSDRLNRLVHLAFQSPNQLELDSEALHQCLDTLESLLDPRSNLTQEIVRCRPHFPNPTTHLHSNRLRKSASQGPGPGPSLSQLAALNDDVTRLGVEFNKRREESFVLYDLFEQERQRLASRIAELESEVEELRADMLEDMAEREALQGTVHGFEAWIDGWQVQYDLALMKNVPGTRRQNGRGWWTKKKHERPSDFDAEALFEGVTAWMRGWGDVEEEFRNREKFRRLRRENRRRG